MNKNLIATVIDAPCFAAGDGVTNVRAAIQQTIDYVYSFCSGTVVLTAGSIFKWWHHS